MPIRLLVSVRDRSEAIAAVDGGADIVDVKEPDRGALGFAGERTICDVLHAVSGSAPVSAALGECTEWLSPIAVDDSTKHTRVSPDQAWRTKHEAKNVQNRSVGDFYTAMLSYVKMGPAGLLDQDGNLTWVDAWLQAHESFSQTIVDSAGPQGRAPERVAVAYADHRVAKAPAPNDILDAIIDAGCAGFLIDTFTKGNGSTLDLLAESDLITLRHTANAAGMFFALAGQITDNHLPAVRRIRPDILAVRGAVCEGNDRRATICQRRLTALKKELLKI